MKKMINGIRVVFSRRDGVTVFLSMSSLLFLLVLSVENGKAFLQAFSLSFMPVTEQFSLGVRTLFDLHNTFTPSSIVLVLLGSILGGLNTALAYVYITVRGGALMESGLYHGVGLVLAFLGIGCAACGTAFLSLILGFFGFSTVLAVFPYKGVEVGYLGLMLLFFATYTLAKKVDTPNVC
jgi:hypothetical protein